jgi:L-lactate utilization protein LutC
MTDQASFLAKVRQAAAAGRAYRVHAVDQDPSVAYLGAEEDLCQRLAAEIDAVGGKAVVVDNLPAAAEPLQAWLVEAQAHRAVCWRHPLLEALGLSDLLAAAGIQCWDEATLRDLPEPERRARVLACDIGITSCDWAIAESGTLVMCAKPGQERVASLLPPWHVAVVHRQQIVPDLIDALLLLAAASGQPAPSETFSSRQDGADLPSPSPRLPDARIPDGRTPALEAFLPELPSNITLITGPSKTGDMELQLTTGVHGPAHWRVLVIRD